MNNRLVGNLALVAAMVVLLVSLRASWARPASVYEQIDLLVDMRHELATEYVEQPDQQAMIEGAIEGMIESLEDPYTVYMPRSEFANFEERVRGAFSGIGAEVTMENNRLQIVTPLLDSPAWEAGVMAGDTVLEIEGRDTLDMPLTEAIELLKGEADTDVTIEVRHANGDTEMITITRGRIEVRSVRGFLRNAQHDYQYMLDREHKVGYIRLSQFNERTVDEFEDALARLEERGVEALILDVRFNPGGLLDAAVQIGDMFLDEGETIVSVKGRVVPEKVYRATDDTLVGDIPVVVLANAFSASASEIITGALADNERALFVGERTFGKGSVQQIKMLEGGQGALKITNAYYYLPSGRNIHRRPDDETWGVDPSPGAYVPMNAEARRQMIEARREADALTAENGSARPQVSPQWIQETLKDPQLAAALSAAIGKLETGDWPTVGQSNAAALVKVAQREELQRQRELLEESLSEVNQELADLDAGDLTPEADDAEADTELEGAILDDPEMDEAEVDDAGGGGDGASGANEAGASADEESDDETSGGGGGVEEEAAQPAGAP